MEGLPSTVPGFMHLKVDLYAPDECKQAAPSVSRSLQGVCRRHGNPASRRWGQWETKTRMGKKSRAKTLAELRTPKAICALTLAISVLQPRKTAEGENTAGRKAAAPGDVSARSAVTSFHSNCGHC